MTCVLWSRGAAGLAAPRTSSGAYTMTGYGRGHVFAGFEIETKVPERSDTRSRPLICTNVVRNPTLWALRDWNPRPQPCEGGVSTDSDQGPDEKTTRQARIRHQTALAALPRQKVSGHDRARRHTKPACTSTFSALRTESAESSLNCKAGKKLESRKCSGSPECAAKAVSEVQPSFTSDCRCRRSDQDVRTLWRTARPVSEACLCCPTQ